MSETKPGKIYQAIPRIMSQMDAISKSEKNKQQGFMYRGIEGIYAELQKRLAKEGVFTVPEILENQRTERVSKSGSVLAFVQLKIEYKLYCDDGSFVCASVIGEAMDSGDKACNKAMSIAQKYMFIQVFCIPTSDAVDPDAESHELQTPSQKTTTKKTDTNDYVFNFGKYKGQRIGDIDTMELRGYRSYLKAQANDKPDKVNDALKHLLEVLEHVK